MLTSYYHGGFESHHAAVHEKVCKGKLRKLTKISTGLETPLDSGRLMRAEGSQEKKKREIIPTNQV